MSQITEECGNFTIQNEIVQYVVIAFTIRNKFCQLMAMAEECGYLKYKKKIIKLMGMVEECGYLTIQNKFI